MDLPCAHQMAIKNEDALHVNPEMVLEQADELSVSITQDPIRYLAESAGYHDPEHWWEHMFEQRTNHDDFFEAIQEAMTALREELQSPISTLERMREAWMRKTIRQAEREMYTDIAVICGAWHVPALHHMPTQKEDNELLKGIAKIKIACTWIPWTNQRLGNFSGYGAGIPSPGWYEHLWHYPMDDGSRWLSETAALFRAERIEVSAAQVMDAVTLANTLAAMRNRSKAGLTELNDAILSTMCYGDKIKMQLIERQLIVRDRIGTVPEETPKPPLQKDIERLQKKLRLAPSAEWKDYTLDLRKETDLERSIMLHRLQLIEIPWGEPIQSSGKGTFKESWRLEWQPELSIQIIEKGIWGNTLEEASIAFINAKVNETTSLSALCHLLEQCIPAETQGAIEHLIHHINNMAATGNDVMELMEVIPSLVNVSRYGNVRKSDSETVKQIAENMILRICISLPAASSNKDEEAANKLLQHYANLNAAILLFQHPDCSKTWNQTLFQVAHTQHSSKILAGYALRLLSDHKEIEEEQRNELFYQSVSKSNTPLDTALWLEGFLKGGGTLLLLDETLWHLINQWIDQLEEDHFIQVLPLLRRSFAKYSIPERRKLGEKVKQGGSQRTSMEAIREINPAHAVKGISVIMTLFGYQTQHQETSK